MNETTRKCKLCKNEIIIEPYSGDFIIDSAGYKHIDCFIAYKTSLKKSAWSIERCEEEICKLKANLEAELSKRNDRRKLTDWLFEAYNVTFLPTRFYTKLDELLKGTYKGLSRPVSAADLLDMWQQKINYLNRVDIENQKKGTTIAGADRINYDLAILLSRYDRYLSWKEAQAEEKKKIESSLNESAKKINYQTIHKPPQSRPVNSGTKNEISIADIIDEI